MNALKMLEENPYRAVSEPYMILGLLAERQPCRIRLFINGENLTGVRQTRWDPFFVKRARRTVAGPWTHGRRWKGAISMEACAFDSDAMVSQRYSRAPDEDISSSCGARSHTTGRSGS